MNELDRSPRLQPLTGDAKARIAVIGASGYSGALAAYLVWNHPKLELAAVTARREAGRRLDDLYPRYRVPLVLDEYQADGFGEIDAAIVAYPHGASAPVVRELIEAGVKVVDISADFRLDDLDTYISWYGEHGAPELIDRAVYGLTELYRDEISQAELTANPGCYPTATVLALAPLAREGLIDRVVVDAKSGVSGAGREPSHEAQFVAVDEDVRPYAVEGHRHSPEIDQELEKLECPAATFVPHLLPIDQGLLASCYVFGSRQIEQDELSEIYLKAYSEERFIEILDKAPGVKEVRNTNYCRIHAYTKQGDDRITVFSAIDNLWKGASGQALQNLNLMLGLDEGEGL